MAAGKRVPVLTLILVLAMGSVVAPVDAQDEVYVEELFFSGFIECSVGYHPFQTTDLCRHHTAPETQDNQHEFVVADGLTASVVVVEWEPDWALVNLRGTLAVTWASPAGFDPWTAEGASPLRIEHDFGPGDPDINETEGGLIDVRAASGPEGIAPGDASLLVLRQHYHLCVGLFFHGAPVPPDYEPCP